MDEWTKARLLEVAETVKKFCDATPCDDCLFDDGMFCVFYQTPHFWDIALLKERLSHDQTDTPQS